MVNRDAPYSGLANLMAMNGRFGDTELVHMSKPEIRGLASLGELTVNPDTGLPEAFSLKAALPIIGGIAGSMIMPGIGSALGSGAMGSLLSGTSGAMIGSALGSFGGGLLAGQPFGQAALGGLMAGATSGIFGGAFGGGGEAVTSGAANAGSATTTGSTAVATGTTAGVPAATAVAPAATSGIVDSTFGGMKIFNPSPAPVISQPSSLQSWLGANKNKLLLGGAGLAAAGLAGDEGGGEVAPSPPITPLTQYTFNRERREGAPRTEEELRRQATQGGNYSFFGPGAFNPIARANEGGLVSLANQQPAQQRSNVTNFMFSDNPQHQNVFDEMFKVGEAMSQPQQQPNTGLMQLAVGGQPKSNIAQMLNPTLRQQVPSLPPFNYDTLRRRASIGQEESPVDIFQTQHEEILRDALGRIVEDSSKEVIETPEEPVAPIAPIPKPVNVFSDDGDPDTAGMSGDDIAGPGVAAAMGMADTEADVGAAAEAAEAEADAEAAGADEAAGPDDALARGGLVGLAKGGRLDPLSKELLRKRMLQRESSGNYSSVNPYKYVGGYQFGAAALEDLGYIKKGKSKLGNKAMWNPKNWTGKNGITDLDSFFKDTSLQDRLFNDYAERNFKTLKGKDVFKKDSSPEHVAGMLAASHLLGATKASKNLSATDKNKISGHEYYKLGKKSIEPSLNLGSTKGEHRRIASQKRDEQKSMPNNSNILQHLKSILPLSEGGTIDQYFEGQVIGKGDGQSDQILFEVEGKNPDMALLSRDEYVLPADAVAMLGNGSSNAGAKELDQFVKSLRQQSFGTQRQQQRVNPQRGLSALV